MEENKKINLEKIINATEYMTKIIGNPYVHLGRKTCKRLRELEEKRWLKETTRRLNYDAEEELRCQKEHYMKPVEKSHISNRYGEMIINLLNFNRPDRNLRIWEKEMCYILTGTTQNTIWRPHKSGLWLQLLMEEEIARSMSIHHNMDIYERPNEKMTIDAVIHWDYDHTDYLHDIKIDSIYGFPFEMIKSPDPYEKRNLNDNKTQLERVVKRRKNK